MNSGAFQEVKQVVILRGLFEGAFSTSVDVAVSSRNTLKAALFRKHLTFESAASSDSVIAFLFELQVVMLCLTTSY